MDHKGNTNATVQITVDVYLTPTATNFDSVNRSLFVAGKTEERTRVKSADVDKRIVTTPLLIYFSDC